MASLVPASQRGWKWFARGVVMLGVLGMNGCGERVIQERPEQAPVGPVRRYVPPFGSENTTQMEMGNVQLPHTLPSIYIFDGTAKLFDWEGVKGSYTVLVSGSLSCGIFLSRVAEVQRLKEEFEPLGVKFYFVYVAEAHPTMSFPSETRQLEDRFLRVGAAQRGRSTGEMPWLSDNMAGEMQEAMGGSPTGDAILDKEGKMVVRHAWLSPEVLRKELERIVNERGEDE